MAKSFCRLLKQVNLAFVAILTSIANMSFNAIRENKILAKISELTVTSRNIGLQQFKTGDSLVSKKKCKYFVMYTHFYINKYIFTPLAFVMLFVMSRHTNCLVYLYIY